MYYMKKHRVAIRIGILSEPFPYLEARAKATLRTVKLLARAGLQVQLTTKNPGGVTDEHVAALKKCPKAMVRVSFSTLDDDLAAKLEPGAKPPSERLAAMRRLSDAGIEVGCRFSPFLHTVDHDYSRIAETGATNVTVELFRFSMLWRHSFPPEFWEIVSGQKFPGGSVKDKESFARQ